MYKASKHSCELYTVHCINVQAHNITGYRQSHKTHQHPTQKQQWVLPVQK